MRPIDDNSVRYVLDNAYAKVTDGILPQTINFIYSFSTGVALITSLAAVVGQYLSFLAMTISLSVIPPVAITAGFALAFYQYQDRKEKKNELDIIANEIEMQKQANENYSKRFIAYFNAEPQKGKALKEQLSLEAAEYVCIKPFFYDDRSLKNRFFNYAVRYIMDAGLCIGVTAFILASFTTIPFIGLPLALTLIGGFVVAALASLLIHSEKYRYQAQMKVNTEEFKRQKDIQKLFEKHEHEIRPTTDLEAEHSNLENTIWDDEMLKKGVYIKLLDQIREAVNKYLVTIKLIDISSKSNTQYSTKKSSIGNLSNFHSLADKAIKYNNQNVTSAVFIAQLIEENIGEDTNTLFSTLSLIKSIADRAPHQSFFSYFGCGNSRLADSIKMIYKRAATDKDNAIDFSGNNLISDDDKEALQKKKKELANKYLSLVDTKPTLLHKSKKIVENLNVCCLGLT